METHAMTTQATLEAQDVDVVENLDIADQVTGAAYSVERPLAARSQQKSNWFFQAVRQLLAIQRLRQGWDSQGGAPPDLATVQAGAGLLELLARIDSDLPKPHIHPTRSGGVQFHWESGPRYFEIELLDPRTARYYYVDGNLHQEIEGQLQTGDSVTPILPLLRAVDQEQ
jgi:hypothetical protein